MPQTLVWIQTIHAVVVPKKVNLAISSDLSPKQWEEILVRLQEYQIILHWMITRKSDYGPPIYGISGVRKKKPG